MDFYVDLPKAGLNGSPYNIDHRIILANGLERIVHEQGEVTFDENNNPVRMKGTAQDITERKKAEEALRESGEQFHALAEAMPQIVWITRADGWNIYFNHQWWSTPALHWRKAMAMVGTSPFTLTIKSALGMPGKMQCIMTVPIRLNAVCAMPTAFIAGG